MIKMVTNFLLCDSIQLEFLGHTHTPTHQLFLFFRYLLGLQDSAKYSPINMSTLGKLSELSDCVFRTPAVSQYFVHVVKEYA